MFKNIKTPNKKNTKTKAISKIQVINAVHMQIRTKNIKETPRAINAQYPNKFVASVISPTTPWSNLADTLLNSNAVFGDKGTQTVFKTG